MTTATLFYSIFHPLKLIVFNSFLFLLLVLSLKLRSFIISLPYLNRLIHWLNINQRIQYKVLSLTYKTLSSSRPAYLHSLVTLNRARSTRSSSLVTLNRPSNPSYFQITKRSFFHTASALWNHLPHEFRQLAQPSSSSPLAISPTPFHKKLKTHLFHSSFPP